jgi:hypothetical protein
MASKKKRYDFTAQNVATAAGVALGTVYAAISTGKIDPSDLGSVVDYIAKRRYPQLREPADLDPLQQVRELEKALGFGVALLGAHRGKAIVHHSIPQGPAFKSARLQAERALSACAAFGTWTVEGEKVQGWACEQKKPYSS